MLPSTILPLLSVLSLLTYAFATYTCDSSSGLTPEQILGSGSTPSSGSGSTPSSSGSGSDICLYADCPYCGQDPTGQLCDDWHKTQLQGGLDGAISSGTSLFGTFGKRSLRSRATSLECADDEVCMIVIDTFLCIDPNSLDFKDSQGGSGNIDSDTYTMSNGEVTSVASTATGLPTPTSSRSKITGTSTEAKATATGVSLGSNTSAAGNVKADSVFGLILVMVGAAGVLL
jgi:hypothetical protein